MIFDFLGTKIVIPKIQLLENMYCNAANNSSSQSDNVCVLPVLFYGESDFKYIEFKLNDSEAISETRNNKYDIVSYLYLKDGTKSYLNQFHVPLTDLKAGERFLPIYNSLVKEIEFFYIHYHKFFGI